VREAHDDRWLGGREQLPAYRGKLPRGYLADEDVRLLRGRCVLERSPELADEHHVGLQIRDLREDVAQHHGLHVAEGYADAAHDLQACLVRGGDRRGDAMVGTGACGGNPSLDAIRSYDRMR
jgi:hypothetical protein